MNKKLSLFFLPMLAVSTAQAADQIAPDGAGSEKLGWSANLKKASVQLSSTEVSHAKEYKDSPNSQLSGDSETVVKGIFDFALTQEKDDYKWENSLFMEYGKTKLKPVDGPNVENETADKILLSTDYARKMWKYMGAYVGPFGNFAYQTEFEPNDDAPRTKIFRGMTGLKMFDGKYIKNLYGGLVGEYDFTYSSKKTTKAAYEVGIVAEYELREGVVFNLDSYWRDYFKYSSYNPHDFEYELSAKANMMVDVYNGLQIGPFVQYFRAEDRGSNTYGASTIIGIEGSYGNLWEL
ncbi:MAG: DUF3078 domain-containing protein [Alphaproteobacteria bacterium]|nr:DUF3078 domain-containing protein [Alphaproteobacteria bacterium]